MNVNGLSENPTTGFAGNNPRILDLMKRAGAAPAHPKTVSVAPALRPFSLELTPAGPVAPITRGSGHELGQKEKRRASEQY